MRKVKKNKSNWVEEQKERAEVFKVAKKHMDSWIRSNEHLTFYAAIGSLESQFFDYANQEDVIFPLEDEKKFLRAYKYISNFFNRLTEFYKEPNEEQTKAGFSIYIQALEGMSEKNKMNLNLNMKNEREHADFLFIAGIVQTIRITDILIKKREEWIQKYYFSFRIQMVMILNVFNKYIKEIPYISEEVLKRSDEVAKKTKHLTCEQLKELNRMN